MKVGYIYDPVFLKHDTGNHPENARRLEAIISYLEETGTRQKLMLIRPRPATHDELTLVHSEAHIEKVREMWQKGGGWLDPDTVVSPGSWDASRNAAGAAVEAIRVVMGGEVNGTFALVRPPGHHATPSRAMGFCLFNNIAIAADTALEKLGLKCVCIIDFDVHHGNGTQEAFYENPAMLYISTHQYPHYPGTGRVEETGKGEGEGANINIPLPAGCGDAEYGCVFEEIVAPAVRRFKPQLIMVSAGYDGHWADPLAMMQLTVTGYVQMAVTIKELADELCNGRLVFCLEGGYDLKMLAASIKATFDVFLGGTDIDDPLGRPPHAHTPSGVDSIIEAVRKAHGLG